MRTTTESYPAVRSSDTFAAWPRSYPVFAAGRRQRVVQQLAALHTRTTALAALVLAALEVLAVAALIHLGS